jgi:integrase
MTQITRRKATVFPYRGKWRVQYIDTFGRQRTQTAETRKDAYLQLSEIEGQVRKGFLNLTPEQIPSLGQYLDYWLQKREQELNPTTHWCYQSHVANNLKPLIGNLRLDSVSARQIQDLYSYLLEERGFKSGTVRKVHSILSSAFKLALKQGLITYSPIAGVTQPKFEQKQIEVFTKQEMECLLRHASQKPLKAHLRWLLALRYGLRQGEVLGLKFGDFDLVSRTVKINRTVNSLPGKGVVELPPKSKHSHRTIPLDAEVIQLISQIQDGSGFVFTAEDGSALEATVDQRRWRALLVESGVRHLPLHSARHSVATHLVNGGVNPRIVQLLLGHSSAAYTLATYVHPSLENMREALEITKTGESNPLTSVNMLSSLQSGGNT